MMESAGVDTATDATGASMRRIRVAVRPSAVTVSVVWPGVTLVIVMGTTPLAFVMAVAGDAVATAVLLEVIVS